MISIIRVVRPALLQKWIAANASGSLKPTARESWFAYLAANGGTGKTISDLEKSATVSVTGSGTTLKERIKDTFK